MIKKSLLTVVVLLGYLGISYAQTGFGSLQGRVVDARTKEPLAFANVVLFLNGIQKGGAQTNIDGYFTIRPITPGTYDVQASYVGYISQKITGYLIGSDKLSTLDFLLNQQTTVLKEVVVTEYVKPLVEKDEVSGQRMSGKEIAKAPTRNVATLVSLTAGVAGSSIKGQRGSGTVYFVDGRRVSGGIGVPRGAMEELNTITGGIPAEYGDLIGGVVSITTKGPSATFHGGLEVVSSQLTDPFGYNVIEGNLTGPILLKDRRAKGTDTAKTILGFLISGNFTYVKDPIQNATGFWKVKDDVYDYLYNNPISVAPNGSGFIPSAELITKDDMEHVKVHPGIPSYSYEAMGKLDFQPTDNINVVAMGTLSTNSSRGYNYTQAMFNYKEASQYQAINNTYSGSIRLTQKLKFGTGEPAKKGEKKLVISNAYYTLSFDYTKQHNYGWDRTHKQNYFDYGYLGKFERYQEPVYTYDYDTIDGKIVKANLLLGYRDTLVTFEADPRNQGTANYTKQLYALNNNSMTNFNNIKLLGGLWNGDAPQYVYALWTNVSTPAGSYSVGDADLFSVKGQASADFNNHSIKIGFEYEQRISRGYAVAGAGLWTVMRQLTNSHLLQLDTRNPIPVYSQDGVFLDTINYRRLNDGTQTTFDKNFRNYLKSIGAKDIYGNPIDDYSYINIDRYSPEYFDLSYFSPEECLKNGIVSYYGYDYLGNKLTKKPSLDDFLNSDQRLIAPINPIYMGGFIQDQFAYKDMIFRLGLRVERFDANQYTLKDKYSLYPVRTVGEVNEFTHPTTMGNDYVVYVDNPFNPTKVIGYRNGDQWYDANGAEIVDPNILALQTTSGTIAPYLVEKNEDNLKLTKESFTDYQPQINVSPRIYFAFPISEKANFFANYDIRVQRPDAGIYTTIDDYYYLEERGTSSLNNAALQPQRITSYEVGFKQALSKNTAISLNAYYNETRNQINVRMINQAYPRSYMTYDNIDFQTTKGISLSYDYRKIRKINNLSFVINYTLQFANGTGSNTASQSGLISAGQPNLRTPLPLDNDYRHMISVSLDYRYPFGNDYNGPVTKKGKKILEATGVNFIVSAHSGSPYSKQANVTETVGIGIRQSEVLKGTVNGSRFPWNYNVNMQLDRDFYLFNKKKAKLKTNKQQNYLYLNVYVLVQNLFNLKQIAGIYRYTGTPDDDGFITSSYGIAAAQQATLSQAFIDQYQVKVNNPDNYSTPRIIRLGASINF